MSATNTTAAAPAAPPTGFYPTPEGFPPPGRLSVEKYEAMIEAGLLTKHDRLELIEGTLVTKMPKGWRHAAGAELCRRAIERALPAGWHAPGEQPLRIPGRSSEPEPDLSVARGVPNDYARRHPGPEDVALVVEVSDATLAADRALARTYLAAGVPLYWLLNVRDRQLEVYTPDAGPEAPTVLGPSDSVELSIAGDVAGRVAVAELLPPEGADEVPTAP